MRTVIPTKIPSISDAKPTERALLGAIGYRPATVKDPMRTIRLSDEFIASLDAWAEPQPDAPVRSEAIRRLVELGLRAKGK